MKKSIVFLLVLFFVIIITTSCSSLLTISTATVVTTAWYDSRTFGAQLDDNVLKIKIYYALYQNRHIKQYTRIVNTVYQGHVLLTGQSPFIACSQDAVKIVAKVHGVKNVYNAIRHSQPISLQNIFLDVLISNQIRLNLFMQKNIHLPNIKVIVENKEVFLLGTVTAQEGLYAEKISQNIKGVNKVFTIFKYMQN